MDSESDADNLELEIEENVQRRDLSADELADGLARLKRLRSPGLLKRIWLFLVRLVRYEVPAALRSRLATAAQSLKDGDRLKARTEAAALETNEPAPA